MRPIVTIAGKEIRESLRNRWVVGATMVLTALAATLALIGGGPAGGVGPLEAAVGSLSSLTIFLLPLIALMLSYDAVVGEVDRGTLMLLLTYPVARWQVVVGKFLGHLLVIALATALGHGAAGLVLAYSGSGIAPEGWRVLAALAGSSLLLGAAFTAMGHLISVSVRDRGTASGLAVGVWLGFVLLYDMALVGALVADQGRFLDAGVVRLLLLANPADAYRLFNLAGAAGAGPFAGLAGQVPLASPLLVAALAGWVVVPLALAAVAFSRKQV